MDLSAGIISDSKSGATGAGRTPSGKLHFPEVNENCRAYGLFYHRHVPEMLQALEIAEKDFIFTPHLLRDQPRHSEHHLRPLEASAGPWTRSSRFSSNFMRLRLWSESMNEARCLKSRR